MGDGFGTDRCPEASESANTVPRGAQAAGRDEGRQEKGAVVGEEGSLEESLEDAMASLAYTVHRQPLNREIMYAILSLCADEREVGFVEESVLVMPEYGQATQNPFRLISFLVTHGGLLLVQRDKDGLVIDDARKASLTEDELDDLVATESVVTTEAGRGLLELAAPARRMGLLLQAAPEWEDTYCELLEFIDGERPSYGKVKELLEGREVLHVFLDGHWTDMQPSVFLDKLEGAGMIRWSEGWSLTEEGRTVLKRLKRGDLSL